MFFKAFLLGLAIAVPLGPIGALCIQRVLARGFWAGGAGGLGTALADALYASLAGLGFARFSSVLATISTPLGILGGGFLIWLGLRSWPRRAPTAAPAPIGAQGHLGTLASTFFLTLANPATILSFAAIFAGLGLAEGAGQAAIWQVVGGVFAGSMAWWILLSGLVARLRHALGDRFTIWVGRASALLMGGFGIWAVARVFMQ